VSRLYKNKRLRKTPIIDERVSLINKIIVEILGESFNSIIETDYTIVNEDDITIYRFKTNSGGEYDLEFILSYINCNTKVGEGVLGDYISNNEKINIINKCFTPVIDVAFVPSEINISDRNNQELYTKETNRGEHIELMGRISYLIKEFIKLNGDISVYVIGKDTKNVKLNIYKNMFNNLFSDTYMTIDGDNTGYDNGCYYFIKR
jgi:hypothetical protein